MEIGDKVKIREDLKVGVKYGGIYVYPEMLGKIGEIEGVDKTDNTFLLKNGYWYSEEMLEPVEDVLTEEDFDKFIEKMLKEPTYTHVDYIEQWKVLTEILNDKKEEIPMHEDALRYALMGYEQQTKKEEDIMENRELLEGNFRIEKLDDGYIVMVEADGVIKEIAKKHDYAGAVECGLIDVIHELKQRGRNAKLIKQKEAELAELKGA
jgi:hypothetical protein